MKTWFKKLLIPSGDKTEVVAYTSWIVRWVSVIGNSNSTLLYSRQESEIFPSEIDATKFADQLKEAHKLLKDRDFIIKIESNQSKSATMIK